MGFLSSLFNFGDKPTTSSSNIVPQYPEELKPYIEEAMKDTQEIYKQRLGEGYQPYGGQTIAGFTPEEIASQQGLKSLVGTQAPLQQEALDLSRIASREFTPEVAQQYMSPYLRTALDAQKVEAQRQYERTKVPQFEADAVAAGGMSGLGTRAAVESAERATGQNRLLANIEAAGQQQAFEDAQNIFKDQTARERQSAAQISTAAPNIFKSALSEQGLLQTMGEQKRDLAQSALDEAYLKYVEEQQFPEQQLGRYQSSIYGNPLLKQPSYNTTGTATGGGPGFGKTLLGLGTAAMGFGTGGGSTIGGSLLSKYLSASGGGIASTMKAQPYVQYMNRRAVGGSVLNPHDGKVTTFEEYNRAEREAEAVAQAVAGLQQESSPVLSTPASTVATAPAPAMASAAPTGLPAALAPAVMPPAVMPPAVMPPAAMPPAAMPQLPGGGLKKAELPDDMPSGFTRPGGAVTFALVPFWNPTTGEEWTAPTGGYIPPPGWEKKGGLGQPLPWETEGTENQPMPEPEYTYDKSRGGFKDVNGELAIDPNTALYGWLEDDDGPYFDQQAFLRDAYNANISGGLRGGLGRHNFIEETQNENEGELYYNYNLARSIPPVSAGLQSLNRRGGGPVMPPVVYRQKNGQVDGRSPLMKFFFPGPSMSDRETMPKPRINPAQISLPEQKRQRKEKRKSDKDKPSLQELLGRVPVDEDESNLAGIGNKPYADKIKGLAALTMSDEDRYKAMEKRRNEPLSILNVSKSKPEVAGADPDDTQAPPLSVLSDPGKEIGPSGMRSPKEAAQIATTAAEKMAKNTFDSAVAIQNINKKTSTEVKGLLNSFAEKYKARAKNDPYKMQKFWFTIAANIMKKGNAFANMAEGLRIAVNDLDATRKEKDKLLMDLEDTMTKSKIKLAGKEGESNIAYEKLNLTQKNMIAKLGTTGLAAFNKQMKANGDYIAALAAAKKADNAARKLAIKENKTTIKTSDYKNLNAMFVNAFSTVAPVFGIGTGEGLNKTQLGQKAVIMTNAGDILYGTKSYRGETGANAASAYIQNEARNYKP